MKALSIHSTLHSTLHSNSARTLSVISSHSRSAMRVEGHGGSVVVSLSSPAGGNEVRFISGKAGFAIDDTADRLLMLTDLGYKLLVFNGSSGSASIRGDLKVGGTADSAAMYVRAPGGSSALMAVRSLVNTATLSVTANDGLAETKVISQSGEPFAWSVQRSLPTENTVFRPRGFTPAQKHNIDVHSYC